MQNYFATLLFPSECLSELRLLEGASCFLSLRDVAGAVMLGWVSQPAGTRAGSPGRAAGGEWGGLGVWTTGRMSNSTEMGGGRLWDKGGLRSFGHTGLGEVRGHLSGPGLAVRQPTGWGAV